jgi:hypothetical protein
MSIRDLLAQRRLEIEAQMKAFREELAEIRLAEDAISKGSASRTGDSAPATRAAPEIREGSIKSWIMKALRDDPRGLETEGVIKHIELIGGPSVPRNSMTPQLSRLKSDGLITQDGRLWRLPDPVQTGLDGLTGVTMSPDEMVAAVVTAGGGSSPAATAQTFGGGDIDIFG